MLTNRNITPPDNGFVQALDATAVARAEIIHGLEQPQAGIAPKYFYDRLGSKLFEAICDLPEYYLTRTEDSIFETHRDDIVRAVGQGTTLIDLGAGNCAKAARLLPVLQPRQYVPVDISADFLQSAIAPLRQRFPEITMTGVGLDFSHEVQLPDQIGHDQRLFFYPGSSIGNFTPEDALAFLRGLRAACEHQGVVEGSLLIGVDLVKSHSVLEAAYDDALGVTAAFNLNVLRHVNAVLGSNFRVEDWRHRAFFNATQSRIEMHLEARRDLTVMWTEGERQFARGETIHTENSYKYTPPDFLNLLESARFTAATLWTDPARHFMVCHARAV